MKKIKISVIKFENEIMNSEIPLFRGAILNSTNEASVLFHNHTESNFRYAYPLIQYKRINGKAAIVCLEDGTEDIGSFFYSDNFRMNIGERVEDMVIESIKSYMMLIQVWKSSFLYNIRCWLPLNEENYEQYKNMESYTDKISFLEKKLIGNILSLGKGLNIRFTEEVECKIIDITKSYQITFKGVKMTAFDLSFRSNVSIPEYTGLGKGVSIGNGIVYPRYESGKKPE